MTINNREVAAKKAEASTTAAVGTCQLWTRTKFNAPSSGDVDGDGDADAIDGWKKEPTKWRHTDRNAPRGVPGAFRNKDGNGHGHRVVMLGNGRARSIDFDSVTKRYAPGKVGTGTIAQIESALGLVWLGWSQSIDGQLIPMPPPPTRGKSIDAALKNAKEALAAGQLAWKYTKTASRKDMIADANKSLKAAVTKLERIPFI